MHEEVVIIFHTKQHQFLFIILPAATNVSASGHHKYSDTQ